MDLNNLKEAYQLALAEYQQAVENYYKNGEGSFEILESKKQNMFEAKRAYDVGKVNSEKAEAQEKQLFVERKASKDEEIRKKVSEILYSDDPALDTFVCCSYSYAIYSSHIYGGMGSTGEKRTGMCIMSLREKIIKELLGLDCKVKAAFCETGPSFGSHGEQKLDLKNFKPYSIDDEMEKRINLINNGPDANNLGRMEINGESYVTTSRISRIMSLASENTFLFEEYEKPNEQQQQVEKELKEEDNQNQEIYQEEGQYQDEKESQEKISKQVQSGKFTLGQIKKALSKYFEKGK